MLFKKLWPVLFAFFLCFPTEWMYAQSSNSQIYRFLEITPNARAAALGGNHIALFEGSSALFYLNPAYLTPESSRTFSATFINYLADARIGFANAAYHFPSVGTVGVGVRYAGYGDMTHYDEQGNDLGSLRAGDLSLITALGTQLSSKLSAGAGVEYIYSSYHNYISTAITANAGLYYLNSDQNFSAGISVRNLGDQLSYYNETREEIPFDVSVGFSKKPEHFPFHLNITFRRLNDWDLRVYGENETPAFFENLTRHIIFGGEAALGDNLTLRLGYNRYAHEQARTNENFDLAGASIGVGIHVKGLVVDISRSSYSKVGGMVQLSVRSQLN